MIEKTVAREVVESAGVDVDKLLDLLVRNAAAGKERPIPILRAR